MVLATAEKVYNGSIRSGADMAPIYHVVIHRNEDFPGYWAKCVDLPGCFTDGKTIQETESNMYESVGLYLRGDYPQVTEYSLSFEVLNG